MGAKTVLVVEDDEKIAELLKMYLEAAHFQVCVAYDGMDGWERFLQKRPDLVLLDLMLPEVDGWQLCRRIRASGDTPIIIATACGELDERVNGLELGADDYVVKPFRFREVVARVKAVLRRLQNRTHDETLLRYGELTIEPQRHRVTKAERLISLTVTEFKILELLASSPERVFSRRSIVEYLQGASDENYERLLDAHVKNLRKKIEEDPKAPRYIRTVHRVGYLFSGGEHA